MAEAEVALVSRDLGWPAKALEQRLGRRSKSTATGLNAAYARYLEVWRLLLMGKPGRGGAYARTGSDPRSSLPAFRAAHELVVAGIAIRRLRTRAARASARSGRARRAPRSIPALTAEVDGAVRTA